MEQFLPHFEKVPYRNIKIETLYENWARNAPFAPWIGWIIYINNINYQYIN
jgi:hypothetical protein